MLSRAIRSRPGNFYVAVLKVRDCLHGFYEIKELTG